MPSYTTQALAAIVQIPAAKDPPDVLDRLINATAAIGASASLFTASIPEGGDELSCFSLFASHPDYASAQDGMGSILAHPWFRFARKHTTSGNDRQIQIEQATDAAAIELARQHGFRSCFIVPTPAGANIDRFEMLCLGSATADDFDGPEAGLARTLARSTAAELHDWLTHYLQQRLRADARLQDSDLELLGLEWQGLCTKQIAARMGLSAAAVDSRFQRINTRLRCAGRRNSAIRAAGYGLLESAYRTLPNPTIR